MKRMSNIPVFAAALALGSLTSFAALADSHSNCSADAGLTDECLTGEEVDPDNQAADGPGEGAATQSVGTVEDQNNGQTDGGSIDQTPNSSDETTNEPNDEGSSLDK